MTRARVLFIVPSLDQSGAEKQLTLAATHLPRQKYEVHVCALTRGGHYEQVLRDADVPVHVIGKRLKWDPFSLWRLVRHIQAVSPAIVHTWMFAANAYGRLASRWAGVPHIVASERCVDEWKSGYHFTIDRWLLPWTDRVVVNARGIERFYERHGVSGDRLVYIPNAVTPPVNEEFDVETMRRRIGVPVDVPLISFVGRLWPQKRVGDLIWAADILRMSGWQFHIAIAGDGPRRASLERFADALEITPIVHFLGQRTDAQDLIRASDMLVLPSKFEGVPNSILEAMSCGKPVVATRIAGTDEVVVDGETGILVPPRQPLELARGIRELLADPAKAKRMGEAGHRRVQVEFNLEKMLAAYERLYDELLSSPVRSKSESEAGAAPAAMPTSFG